MILESPKSRSQESRPESVFPFPRSPQPYFRFVIISYGSLPSTMKISLSWKEKRKERGTCVSQILCTIFKVLHFQAWACFADKSVSPAHGPQTPAVSCVPVCMLCAGPALRNRNSTCFSKKLQRCPMGVICRPHQACQELWWSHDVQVSFPF